MNLERHDAAATLPLAGQMRPLYRACFSEPPWNETEEEIAAFDTRLSSAVCRPDFRSWTMRDEDGDLLAVCYGWPTPAELGDCAVYHRLIAAIGLDAAKDLTRGAFEIAELMVAPHSRGVGIGGRLVATAISGWPSAWLSTLVGSPAARLYERHGWRRGCVLPYSGTLKKWAVYTWASAPAPR